MGRETLYDNVREASATGIPLRFTEIGNKLLFANCFNDPLTFNDSLTCLHCFQFFITVLNLLFYRPHHFIGSGLWVVTSF